MTTSDRADDRLIRLRESTTALTLLFFAYNLLSSSTYATYDIGLPRTSSHSPHETYQLFADNVIAPKHVK